LPVWACVPPGCSWVERWLVGVVGCCRAGLGALLGSGGMMVFLWCAGPVSDAGVSGAGDWSWLEN
jgi:hypothetical protein